MLILNIFILLIIYLGNHKANLILKSHMIIMDFLNLYMFGLLDTLSISINYQPIGNEKILSINIKDALYQFQNLKKNPFVDLEELPTKLILPGFCLFFIIS